MAITLHWWYVSIFLVLLPLIYRIIVPYESSGGLFDYDYGGVLLGIVCWVAAIAFTIGKLL